MAAHKVTCAGTLKKKGGLFGHKHYYELQGNTQQVDEYKAAWRVKSEMVANSMPLNPDRKRLRVPAYEWKVCLENLLVVSARIKEGLSYFKIPAEWLQTFTNVFDWPR